MAERGSKIYTELKKQLKASQGREETQHNHPNRHCQDSEKPAT